MKQKTSQTHPLMEMLESRIAPAGVVNATFSHGKLLLVGDSSANDLSLIQVGGGDFVMTGNGGTLISLNGAAAAASVSLTGAIKGVSANMGDGNDAFVFAFGGLSGKLSFKGGNGDDAFTANQVRVGGGLLFDGGDGDDVCSLNTTNVAGGIVANLGNGNNMFVASGLDGGSCHVVGGGAADVMSVNYLSLKGGMTFEAGDGGNTLITGNSFKTGGAVNFVGGSGNDSITFGSELSIGGKLRADLGAGNNTLTIVVTNAHLAGVSVKAAGGNDTIGINAPLFENTGSFKASLGDGTNFTGITTTLARIDGNLKVSAGAQDDVFTYSGTGVINGNVNVNLGSGTAAQTINMNSGLSSGIVINGDLLAKISTPTGNSGATIIGVSVAGDEIVNVSGLGGGIISSLGDVGGTATFSAVTSGGATVNLSDFSAGATSIVTGGGNDLVIANDIHVHGKLLVKTGAGNDIVAIDAIGGTNLASTFDALAKIILGDGDDELNIGANTTTAKGVFNAKAIFDGGAGADTANVSAAVFGNQYAIGPVTLGFEVLS